MLVWTMRSVSPAGLVLRAEEVRLQEEMIPVGLRRSGVNGVDTSITLREALGRDGWEYITKGGFFLHRVSWVLEENMGARKRGFMLHASLARTKRGKVFFKGFVDGVQEGRGVVRNGCESFYFGHCSMSSVEGQLLLTAT